MDESPYMLVLPNRSLLTIYVTKEMKVLDPESLFEEDQDLVEVQTKRRFLLNGYWISEEEGQRLVKAWSDIIKDQVHTTLVNAGLIEEEN